MKDNIFKFGDFLNEDKFNKVSKKKYSVLESEEKEEETDEYSKEAEESSEEESEETSIYESFMVENLEDSEESEEDSYDDSEKEIEYAPKINYSQIEEEEEVESKVEEFIDESKNESFYNLYADKSENFICDISIQGADPKQTEARLVVESGDWTLMFYGELRDGKCIVPLKKLSILKEGQIGDIRLEVIAEGNLFIPWEDKFKVKVSKSVTVKVNEQKSSYRNNTKKDLGVKVKVKR